MEFSWLDFDREDREKSKNILKLLEEPGTVDELGFGVIRNYFANRFFPGTTTLQTKAKYFIICPFIFKELEEEKFETTEKYFEKLAQEERKCAEILIKKCNNDESITGKNTLRNGEWVVRPPSDIYWNGFRQYKIFEPKGVLNKRVTFRTYANMVVKEEAKDFWDIDTMYRKDWRKQLNNENSIELTKEEANYLRKKIISSQNKSLLAKCLEDEHIEQFTKIENFEQFGSFVSSLNVPQEIKDEYTLAKDLANFLYCAQIRYNCIIDIEEGKEEWKKYKNNLKQYAKKIQEIPNEKIKEIVSNKEELIKFIYRLMNIMLSDKNIEDIEKDIDNLVQDREIKNKGKTRSKIYKIKNNIQKLESNEKWIGLGKLQYRIKNAKDLASDIKKGLEQC